MNHTVYGMFENKVREDPAYPAVSDPCRSLTRRELDRLADTIASMIPEGTKRVGIVMDHSAVMIAALFAVLKRGAAYVPAEPFFPDDRIRFMMQDGEAAIVITNTKYAGRLQNFAVIAADRDLRASGVQTEDLSGEEDLAYILYTSGSTGTPKGVSVRNRNVCHYVRAFENEFHTDEKDIMLQYSVCSFDIFVEEVFATLLNGAVLAIPSDEDKKDIGSLMRFVASNRVTQISGFPYLLQEMNYLDSIPDSLRLLISGGDVLRASYVTNLVRKVTVYNTYGPSETTVCASYYNCSAGYALADGTYPVGKPVLGSGIVILDENREPVKAGEIGEICITGGGVSAGYIGNREIENEAFMRQEDGSIRYVSGDLGYYLPDGNLAFLHRKDTQVMIMGRRVETTEVESVLCKCPEIEKAVVKSCMDEHHMPYLVAYIVTRQEDVRLSTIREKMGRFLPNYMIPEFFVNMQSLPLNANGKVNLDALPVVMKEGM